MYVCANVITAYLDLIHAYTHYPSISIQVRAYGIKDLTKFSLCRGQL